MSIEKAFIKELRAIIDKKPRGYQAQLADEAGIKKGQFSNMLHGRRPMGEDLRIALADLTGMDYERLRSEYLSGKTTDALIMIANSEGVYICENEATVNASNCGIVVSQGQSIDQQHGMVEARPRTVTLTELEHEVYSLLKQLSSRWQETALRDCKEKLLGLVRASG